MSKWAKKVDVNQPEIVKFLHQVGAWIQHYHKAWKRCPDLLVGWQKSRILMELKSTDKSKMTGEQLVWHDNWKGKVYIVRTVDEAMMALNSAVR